MSCFVFKIASSFFTSLPEMLIPRPFANAKFFNVYNLKSNINLPAKLETTLQTTEHLVDLLRHFNFHCVLTVQTTKH